MKKINWKKSIGVIFLSLVLIFFTQWVKTLKNPESMPPTLETAIGLFFLGLFAIVGMYVKSLFDNVKHVNTFPVMG